MNQKTMTGIYAGLVLVLAPVLTSRAESDPTPQDSVGIKDLGVMTGFYRYSAVLGPRLASGADLRQMPAWMMTTDFPYEKKPGDMEVPFADGLSMVRLLGWGSDPGNDLVYRDKSGALQYRWSLLKARLDPYVTHGYTDLTLVMDNVPWCLPTHPNEGEPKPNGYGQAAPPGNWDEWRTFIRQLCAELKIFYGPDTVKKFRFRMGTEMQGKERFTGDLEDYLKYYDYAADGIRQEIPEAGIGPFNQASLPAAADVVPSLISVAKHCAFGTNYATGGRGAPLDFLARSFYYFPKQTRPGVFANISPDQRVPEMAQTWQDAMKVSPQFAHLSREIQEFGPSLQTEDGIYGPDTGARGAAQTFETLVDLREAGADRIWHWDLFENINPRDPTRVLLESDGWLDSILDHMRGGEMYVPPVESGSAHGNLHKALLSVSEKQAILVVSCWNVDRVKHDPDQLTVDIPASVLAQEKGAVRMVSFNEDTSVYDVIRRDFAGAGLLSARHLQHRGAPATPAVTGNKKSDVMASNPQAARAFLEKNWPKYEGVMHDSLVLKDFTGTIQPTEEGLSLTFKAATPSVTVLVLPGAMTKNQ